MTIIDIKCPKQLGEAARATRKQLGLTQSEVALASKVGVRFIVDLEAGKSTVRLESVLRVIDSLGGTLQLSGMTDSASDNQSNSNKNS